MVQLLEREDCYRLASCRSVPSALCTTKQNQKRSFFFDARMCLKHSQTKTSKTAFQTGGASDVGWYFSRVGRDAESSFDARLPSSIGAFSTKICLAFLHGKKRTLAFLSIMCSSIQLRKKSPRTLSLCINGSEMSNSCSSLRKGWSVQPETHFSPS